ncbi:hypothetical protein [Sediminitomix flava]|uniref:YD repeat-containing protein n=1 Tax=Sediminitomix flava TaxID=379075 RepID=A0A315ZVE4_SEDFL|nr:hypothetical protein [Sediminitomix flava]PWJ40179.1 hypothetical protein BC781_105247 [Sediminitomix flava]
MNLFYQTFKCVSLSFLVICTFGACTDNTITTDLVTGDDCYLTSMDVDHYYIKDSIDYHTTDLFQYTFNGDGKFVEAIEYDNGQLESNHSLRYDSGFLVLYNESWVSGDAHQLNFYYKDSTLEAVQDIFAFNLSSSSSRISEEKSNVKYYQKLRELGNKRASEIANQYEVIYAFIYEDGNNLPVGAIDNLGGEFQFVFNENSDLTEWSYQIQREGYQFNETYSFSYDDKVSIFRNRIKNPFVASSFFSILDYPNPSYFNNITEETHSWLEVENEVILDSGNLVTNYEYSYDPISSVPLLVTKVESNGNRNYQLSFDCK